MIVSSSPYPDPDPPPHPDPHPNPHRGISGSLGGGKKTADLEKNPIAEAGSLASNPSPNPKPSRTPNPDPNPNPNPNPDPDPHPNPDPNPNQAGSLAAFVIVFAAITYGGLPLPLALASPSQP